MYDPELTKATIAELKSRRVQLQTVLREGVGIAPGGIENLNTVIGNVSGRIATLEGSATLSIRNLPRHGTQTL